MKNKTKQYTLVLSPEPYDENFPSEFIFKIHKAILDPNQQIKINEYRSKKYDDMINNTKLYECKIDQYEHKLWYYFDSDAADMTLICDNTKSMYYKTKKDKLPNTLPIIVNNGIINFDSKTAIINITVKHESDLEYDFDLKNTFLLINFFMLGDSYAEKLQEEISEMEPLCQK